MLDTIRGLVDTVFGGDLPKTPPNDAQIAARAAVIYLSGVMVVRIGKSRMLSRATALDVILGFMVGSVLSRGITGSASLSGACVGAAALVALHWLCTGLAARWHWLGNLLKGRTYLLMEEGRLIPDNLRRSHMTERDLQEALRLSAHSEDLLRVQTAHKERNGEVGFVLTDHPPQVVSISVRDGVQVVQIELS